jgi:NhaA family Na+:H+ antiporter
MKRNTTIPHLFRQPISLIYEFLRLESAAGLLLMAAAVIALVLANSPIGSIYRAVLAAEIGLPGASLSLLHWINDGLMAVFFLLVGLEIKRELSVGELSSARRATLPGIAALGGMVCPALIYAAFNASDPTTLRGWAIPAATDIAFALGILALLGRRAPTSLKVFRARHPRRPRRNCHHRAFLHRQSLRRSLRARRIGARAPSCT